jgi:fatty acid/phospholipid biosynthesis enzyme
LADKDKAGLSETKAIALMLKQPSMIKRPVLDAGAGCLCRPASLMNFAVVTGVCRRNESARTSRPALL